MTTRAAQKERTRQAIIQAALELSEAKGFNALSLREVTREAGIAPATFYRHFSDMDELGLTLVDEIGMKLRQLMRQARQRVLTKEKSVVRTSIETFMEFIDESPQLFRLLSGDRVGGPRGFREALQKEKQRFIDELIDDLSRDQETQKHPLADIPAAADIMVNQVFSSAIDALDLPKQARQQIAEKLVLQLRMILAGSRALAQRNQSR